MLVKLNDVFFVPNVVRRRLFAWQKSWLKSAPGDKNDLQTLF
jgi:hypothetical protein